MINIIAGIYNVDFCILRKTNMFYGRHLVYLIKKNCYLARKVPINLSSHPVHRICDAIKPLLYITASN